MASKDSLQFFIDYLKINTSHPKPDYAQALSFLKKRCEFYGFEWKEIDLNNGYLIGLATIKGSQPELPSILLNGHTDVVPVVLEKWNHDPFGAEMDQHGNIFARGTQDMKCVSIQHIEALGRLKTVLKVQLKRTVHISFVPDEEIGGHTGMETFLTTKEFQQLNVGLALDEGLANPQDSYTVFYGERAAWWIKVKAEGPTGHGSRFVENTAMEKLIRSINHFLEFRKKQETLLHNSHSQCGKKTLGDVTTVNLTALKGGVTHDKGETFSINVIPTIAEAYFDIRIAPTVNLDEFKKQLESWTSEEGVSLSMISYVADNKVTSISSDSFWWSCFERSLKEYGCNLQVEIFPAATDSRYLRAIGIPAFGFSPIRNTPILLHDHNEFLNKDVFLEGIEVFVKLIKDLANHI